MVMNAGQTRSVHTSVYGIELDKEIVDLGIDCLKLIVASTGMKEAMRACAQRGKLAPHAVRVNLAFAIGQFVMQDLKTESASAAISVLSFMTDEQVAALVS